MSEAEQYIQFWAPLIIAICEGVLIGFAVATAIAGVTGIAVAIWPNAWAPGLQLPKSPPPPDPAPRTPA